MEGTKPVVHKRFSSQSSPIKQEDFKKDIIGHIERDNEDMVMNEL